NVSATNITLTASSGDVVVTGNVTSSGGGNNVNISGRNISGVGTTGGAKVTLTSIGTTGIGTDCNNPLSVNKQELVVTANNGSAFLADSYSGGTSITVDDSTVSTGGTFFLHATSATAGTGTILTAGPNGITGPANATIANLILVSDSGSIGDASVPSR